MLRVVEQRDVVAQQQRLDALADLVHLLALGEADARHPGAGVGDEGDETLGLEHAQRLAHRDPAGAVPVGEVLLPHAVARARTRR